MIVLWMLTAIAFLGSLAWVYRAASAAQNPSLSVHVWLGLLVTLLSVAAAFTLITVMAP